MAKAIEVKNFTKKYKDVIALDDVTMNINLGKITGVMGPNASGKTTLLKALAGFIRPDNGEILFAGEKINNFDKNKLAYLPDEKFLSDYQSIKEAGLMYKDFFADFDDDLFENVNRC